MPVPNGLEPPLTDGRTLLFPLDSQTFNTFGGNDYA